MSATNGLPSVDRRAPDRRHRQRWPGSERRPSAGVNRPAYSDADVTARRRRSRHDARPRASTFESTRRATPIGSRAAVRPGLPPLVIGSHTDTVPDGGRYDGALGVLAAIEVARVLAERGVLLRHPLEVVDFQNEEGGLIGSKIVAGRLAADALDLVTTSGITIGTGIERLGGDPARLADARRLPNSIAGYLELHIEQGRVIERAGAEIGVVEGLVGIRYWEVTFDGVASHAGTTPMADRHDALLAAARFVDAVHAVVTATPGRHVGTVGRLAVFPGGSNVIPGRVVLTLELRDLEVATMNALFERIAVEGQRIAADTQHAFPGCPDVDERAVANPSRARGRRSSRRRARSGFDPHEMVSGAGHDAQNMALLGPAGMIFVPSVGGISHSPAELTVDRDRGEWRECSARRTVEDGRRRMI